MAIGETEVRTTVSLMEALKARQGTRSQQEFADELGIGQSYLSQLYRGEKHLSRDAARRIAQNVPELKDEVADYLVSGGENGNGDAAA